MLWPILRTNFLRLFHFSLFLFFAKPLAGAGRTTAMWRAIGMSSWRDKFDTFEEWDMWNSPGADREALKTFMRPAANVVVVKESDYMDVDDDEGSPTNANKLGPKVTARSRKYANRGILLNITLFLLHRSILLDF
jgi:hypothetical protein